MSERLLACDNLEVFYSKYLQVLRGVTLEVGAGEAVAVLGPNGAGKTTLIRTIMGLIEDQPERGTVRLEGTVIDGWETGRRVQAGIACVPEGREVFSELTVEENLSMGAWVEPRARARTPLDEVYRIFPKLAARRRQDAGTLSGGEQQMLAVGRALMSRPRIILLDEPSLGLAPMMIQEIFSVIARLKAEGIALLLVEQNARAALTIADRGYVLEGGRVVLTDSAEGLLANPDVQEFYLGEKRTESIKGFRRYRRRRRWA